MNEKLEKPSSYHHGNLRESLLTHLLELIRSKGFESFSLRQLAARVGVSQAAIYRHFADKEALLAELASQALLELMAVVNEAMQGAKCVQEKLRLACSAYLAYAVENPEKYRLMFGATIQNRDDYPGLVDAGEQALDLLLSFIQEGRALGEFSLSPASCELMASSCWASLHGYALFLIDGLYERLNDTTLTQQAIEYHIDMLLKLLTD